MTATDDPLDLNGMVGASEGFGPATMQLEAEGAGADTKDVDASGGLNLAAGEFPSVDVFTGIDKALGSKWSRGPPTRRPSSASCSTTTSFGSHRSASPPSSPVSISSAPSVSRVRSISGSRWRRRARGDRRCDRKTVLDVLADDDGRVPIPMTITGTMEQAKVRPDAKALMAQARAGAKREVREKATEAAGSAIRGFLGGRKKKN